MQQGFVSTLASFLLAFVIKLGSGFSSLHHRLIARSHQGQIKGAASVSGV